MRRRVRAVGTACLVVLVALAGCTSSDAEGTVRTPVGVVAVAAALHGPGTELAPGVPVPEGTELVGEIFPLVDMGPPGAAPEPGWQAVLLVRGDAAAAWQDLADALGVGEAASAVASCVVSRPLTGAEAEKRFEPTPDLEPSARLLPEPAIEAEDRIDCSAYVGTVRMALAVGAPRCPDPARCREAPVSHLVVQVGGVGLTGSGPLVGTDLVRYERVAAALPPGSEDQPGPADWPPLPDGPVIAPELPEGLAGSRLPAPGELLDDGLDPFLSEPDRFGASGYVAPVNEVPPGSRSLVAPALVIECNSGLAAVLDQPGRPAGALDAYDDADPTGDDKMVRTSGATVDGRAWSHGLISTAGGYYLSVTAVADEAGERSTVLVTECGD